MTEPAFAQLKAILSRVLDLPEAERAAYLDAACGADASLRAEVERILAADPSRLRALQTGGIDQWMREGDLAGGAGAGTEHPASVGSYRILRPLGEGGMGTVYLAAQTGPIRREVALKLIKLGMDTREVIARFEAERQALAWIDHPNVAKVFDAGASEDGRPYFVMEYVPGVPITEFCDRERLGTPARLRLFIDVCLALHHAHQKGIIHRDVKPSNVLVFVQDGKPMPKVIDFGVAKATNQRLTERTFLTERGLFLGTPEYMSPEQAETTGMDVDTTSDVYSLGVLLYELLTGSLPIDPEVMRQGGWEAIRRRLREVDPPRPSDRVRAHRAAGTEIASRRATSVSALQRQLRGDLDWVVMRAMEKDRSRRYSSASELAADVGRALRGEAVSAGPRSTIYRVRKLVRRHRVAVAVTGVVLGSLTVALVESNRQRGIAERARDESVAVTGFLADMLAAADPRRQGRATPIGEILDRAGTEMEERFVAQPLVQAELRTAIGSAYRALGDYPAARAHLARAVETRSRALGPEHRRTLEAVGLLAILAENQGRYSEAESLQTHALAASRRTLRRDDPAVADAMSNLAATLGTRGRRNEAIALLREALPIQLRTLGEQNRETLGSMHDLANFHREAGDLAAAESLHARVLRAQEQMLPPEHPEILNSLNSLSVLYLSMKRSAEAESMFTRIAGIRRRTLGPDHPETMTALNNLASLHAELGRYQEAASEHRTIFDARLRVLGRAHPHTIISMGNLGDALSLGGDPAAGLPYLSEAEATAKRVLGEGHAIHAVTLRKLGVCLGRQARYRESERAILRAFALLTKDFGPAHERTRLAARDAAELYAAWGKQLEADEWRRRADVGAGPPR
jgi:serine/threonine protein kinase/tetratricopeptide (TPR) repeat protein